MRQETGVREATKERKIREQREKRLSLALFFFLSKTTADK
jgi:hypothetical protein